MGKDSLIEINQLKDQLKKQDEKISETVEILQSNIVKETEIIDVVNKYRSKQRYLGDMYNDAPDFEIENMPHEKYVVFKVPLESIVISGESAIPLNEHARAAKEQWREQYDVCASMNTIASSAATSASQFSITEKNWFPDGQNITHGYKIIDETNDHIEMIKSALAKDFPDIAKDFNAFLLKFRSIQTSDTQYQDLIGIRSTFFFKMIYDFAEQNYGSGMSRKKQIEKFVFGTAPIIASADPLINECFSIYQELSSQDSSGNSVKMGNVSTTYIQTMFRRLIANIAAVLQLRSRNFKP